MKAVMTIAGSDSSGGAGIQADLRTFAALNTYGTSAITALTAQNTTGVQAVHGVPPSFLEQQTTSVLDDIDVHAIKTGMLFDAETTRTVARVIRARYADALLPLVVDPVCVSTSGHSLLHPDAVEVMITDLIPLATIITPNKDEAELLLATGTHKTYKIIDLEGILSASGELLQLGQCTAVLLKGGHITASMEDVNQALASHPDVEVVWDGIPGENMEILRVDEPSISPRLVVDVLRTKDQVTLFVRTRIETTSTHGTGCTLSAALACELAKGASLIDATRAAVAYTHGGIANAIPFGKGNGPLNHLHATTTRLIPAPTPSNAYPFTQYLISNDPSTWKKYVEHDFVKMLGKGTLPVAAFKHFIIQDYHYLLYYSRAYALLAAKSPSFPRIEAAANIILHINREIQTHKKFCASFGIEAKELEEAEEDSATRAYGGYLIDIGVQGDSTKLEIALLACLLGYGEVGLWLKKQAETSDSWVRLEGNPYLQWIEDYSGKDYQDAVRVGLATIEARAAADPPNLARLAEWTDVWRTCTKLERDFWGSALKYGWDDTNNT